MPHNTVTITTIISVFLTIIVAGMTYGCSTSNDKYYQMAHECTAKGGSFIPVSGNNSAICLMTAKVN